MTMHDTIRHLLKLIFNDDFSARGDTAEFHRLFFAKTLTIGELRHVYNLVTGSDATIGGRTIPAAIHIKGNREGAPFVVLAQLHGNEPAGLAGILMAMALASAGKLDRDVIGVIGNPLAAGQYFEAWAKAPDARQETRDMFRAGIFDDGRLRPDGNRIPVDFLGRSTNDPHIKRAQELFALGESICGIADIHTARGNMVCITDHKRDSDLKHSPIRKVLTGLAEAISANASGAVTVQTLKTVLSPLKNIQCQTGIEAGRHEDPDAPQVAASFTLSQLFTLGFTPIAPFFTQENGIFQRYAAQPRLTYADLPRVGSLQPDDKVYMAREGAPGKDGEILPLGDGRLYSTHQYDEMEPILKGQVVAVAVPSGAVFRAPEDFSGIFLSKSATLYDKDPAVGPWPVSADQIASVKFCFPCEVSPMHIAFGD